MQAVSDKSQSIISEFFVGYVLMSWDAECSMERYTVGTVHVVKR